MPAEWRAMRAADLPAVEAVAEAIHLEFPEDEAVFAERHGAYLMFQSCRKYMG